MVVARESFLKKLAVPFILASVSASIVLFIPPDDPFPIIFLVITVTLGFYTFLKVFTPFYYAVLGAAMVLFLAVLLYFDLLYSLNLALLIGAFVMVSLLLRKTTRKS